jgi:hypothetical protein
LPQLAARTLCAIHPTSLIKEELLTAPLFQPPKQVKIIEYMISKDPGAFCYAHAGLSADENI